MPAKVAKKAKKAAKKPVKKVDKKGGKKGKKRGGSKMIWSRYIYKVLRQVHKDIGMSTKAMSILNSLISDIYDRLVTEGSRLCRISKSKTLTSREIQTAVRLTLPGELGKHAMAEGTKAVAKFSGSRQK